MNTNTNTDTEMKTDTSHYDKCRTMMMKHKKNHMLRIGLVTFLMIINAYVKVVRSPIDHGAVYLWGFFFGIGILIYCIITLIIGLFAVPEKPKLLAATCILLFIGIIGEWIAPYLGFFMLALFFRQIPEAKEAVWIKQQEGYPHFNERFTEQMENFGKEYQPDHKFDHLHDTEMPDMPEMPSPDFVVKEMPSVPEFAQDIPDVFSSDLTATEKTAIPEMMQDITEPAISDLTTPEQPAFPEILQNITDSTISDRTEVKSAPELAPDIPETGQMQNNDLGTDRILMKYSKNDINI